MKLTPQHHQAIDLLILGKSGKETAGLLAVTPESVSIWRHDYDFIAVMNGRLEDNHAAIQTQLRNLATLALQTLTDALSDSETPVRYKIDAAFKILELINAKPSEIESSDPERLQRDWTRENFLL